MLVNKKKNQRIFFQKKVDHIEFSEENLFVVSGETVHVLNFKGKMIRDFQIGNKIQGIISFNDVLVFKMVSGQNYAASFEGDALYLLPSIIQKIKSGTYLIYSTKTQIYIFGRGSLKPKCVLSVKEDIIDFAEHEDQLYILFKDRVCRCQIPENNTCYVIFKELEMFSRMGFVRLESNSQGSIILESQSELVIYNPNGKIWTAPKLSGFTKFEVNHKFLMVLSDTIQIFSLQTGDLKVSLRPQYHLRIYSDTLYEISISDSEES